MAGRPGVPEAAWSARKRAAEAAAAALRCDFARRQGDAIWILDQRIATCVCVRGGRGGGVQFGLALPSHFLPARPRGPGTGPG